MSCAACAGATCYFSDVDWRRHPDDRAFGAFNQVLNAPFSGADHRARALIATAVYHRYSGDEDFPRQLKQAGLLNEEDEIYAKILGLPCGSLLRCRRRRRANCRITACGSPPTGWCSKFPAGGRPLRPIPFTSA